MEVLTGKEAGARALGGPARRSGFTSRGFIGLAVLFLAASALLYWAAGLLERSFTRETTDDAFLDAHVVVISPKIAGHVSAVHVVHNQDVKQGDPLLEIEPQDWEALLAARQAGVSSADANRSLVETTFDLLKTRVQTAELTARQAEADADAAKAVMERAQADFERARGLLQQQIIPQADFDTARAAAVSEEAAYKSAKEKVATETSRVKEAQAQLVAAKSAYDQAVAQVQQSKADYHISELNLSYTKLVAPVNGRVTRKNVEPGSYVQSGQPLLALVEPHVWVVANYKETQLANIRPGQAVEIEIDSVPGRIFRGRVDSLQAGSGARFSLLPPENAVGNYVKVVQRVPVKIVFPNDPRAEHILGPGMSVVPSIIISDFHLPEIFRIAGALLLSALLVWIIVRMIRSRQEAPLPAPTG